uniref:Trichohyalin-plectin-homology domain-containing protein n=1 Tax=Strix occidentalis caurina TaxID=311401 RepID=A0A8D0G2W5_STROC
MGRVTKDNLVLYFLPNEVDVRQVIVLPKAEWERIQDNLSSTTREAARILAEKKEREEMHLRSKAAVKDWPNTIMGLAQQKLKAKKLRKEREEEERKLLDLEEEQFQVAKRKEAINNAKTYLYYQNERVKGLHSALLLAEVLKERDAQVEFKKLKSDVNKKKDEEKEHERKEAILREQEKAHQRYMNQQALRRDQLEQIKERKHQADLAKLEEKREGEQIQRLNRLYQLEIQRRMEKEQEEKAERQRTILPTQEHVADQKIIKAVEEQKQMEEDDRIKAHLKAKETIAKLIKKKEAEMRRLKQEHQDKLISQLAEQMNAALKKEDDRLARDIAKKEAEQEKKRKEKEAKEKAAIESIAEHRAAVVRNLACSYFCLLQLRSLAQSWWLWCHASGVLHQQAKKQQEKEADLDYDAQTEVIALCKEREFQSYAKQLIERESKTTHHLYPLLKVSKDRRGLGHGPFSRGRAGIHTSFQAQDGAGTQLPCSSCTTAQKVKT